MAKPISDKLIFISVYLVFKVKLKCNSHLT